MTHALLPLAALTLQDKSEWAKGVPFTTDWNAAIKEAQESGKMLLVFNGWEKPGV